jgi:DNA repair protein RadC
MKKAHDSAGTYDIEAMSDNEILAKAEAILERRFRRLGSVSNPRDAGDYLRARLAHLDHEQFHGLWLDNRHRIIACECHATGTIDGASVHPREIVKAALRHGAASVVFAHNHPSGSAESSQADRLITQELMAALKLIGVRVLDHLIIGSGEPTSMAARGQM